MPFHISDWCWSVYTVTTKHSDYGCKLLIIQCSTCTFSYKSCASEAAPAAKSGEKEGGIGTLAAELSAEKAELGGEK